MSDALALAAEAVQRATWLSGPSAEFGLDPIGEGWDLSISVTWVLYRSEGAGNVFAVRSVLPDGMPTDLLFPDADEG